MNGRYLLDTGIIIALFKGEQSVQDGIKNATEILIPSVAIGELFYGAFHSTDVPRHLRQVRGFVGASVVLPCDGHVAEVYGRIKNHLRAKGRPIPENDVWIAAVAEHHGLSVVTRDKHFDEIDGLARIRW